MELNDVVSVSGKSGLYKIIKPTRNGVILETLDNEKKKLIATGHHRVSALNEISIYTYDEEGSRALSDILVKIKEEFDEDPGLDGSSSPEELESFLKHILPDYDTERVYPSDIKRLVSWYKILYKFAPEILNKTEDETSDDKED